MAVFNAEKRKKAHGMRRKVEDYEQPNSYSAVVTVRVYACVCVRVKRVRFLICQWVLRVVGHFPAVANKCVQRG